MRTLKKRGGRGIGRLSRGFMELHFVYFCRCKLDVSIEKVHLQA